VEPATPALVRDLFGHSGGVAGLRGDADDRRIFSVSEDQTLKVWDLVNTCAVMPDGQRVDCTTEPTPKDALFNMQPQHIRVDATNKATAQLVTSAGTTDVKVTATASVPDGARTSGRHLGIARWSGSSGAIDIPLLPAGFGRRPARCSALCRGCAPDAP
jgi:hypothetical protein